MVTPKIKELKDKIKKLNEEALEIIKNGPKLEELEKLSEDDKKIAQDGFREKLKENRVVRGAVEQELKIARMNKNGSAFFEWNPTGRNRQQRRNAIRNRRLINKQYSKRNGNN
jgi:pyruvate formate-lyase activating enzyme-like uncharacterized protein